MKTATPQSVPDGVSSSAGISVSTTAWTKAFSVGVRISGGADRASVCVGRVVETGVACGCWALAGSGSAALVAATATVRKRRRGIASSDMSSSSLDDGGSFDGESVRCFARPQSAAEDSAKPVKWSCFGSILPHRPGKTTRREVALKSSAFQSGRHVLVLALKRHAGGERHGLHQGGEVLLQIFVRILLQRRRAEMALQYLARGRRHRHRHIPFAAKTETKVHVLAQQLRCEGRGPVEIDQRR